MDHLDNMDSTSSPLDENELMMNEELDQTELTEEEEQEVAKIMSS